MTTAVLVFHPFSPKEEGRHPCEAAAKFNLHSNQKDELSEATSRFRELIVHTHTHVPFCPTQVSNLPTSDNNLIKKLNDSNLHSVI